MNISIVIFMLAIVIFWLSVFFFNSKTSKFLSTSTGVIVFVISLYASVNWDY